MTSSPRAPLLTAERYVAGGERATFARADALQQYVDEEYGGRFTPAEFLVSSEYLEYSRRELGADRWEPHLRRPVRRILDAGSGAGGSSLALADRYPEARIVGVDVETDALELARQLGRDNPRVEFLEVRLEDFEPGDGFDVIQCREVLEHVYDPRLVLTRLLGWLRPGGVLFVETPNYLYPWEPHVRLPMLPKSPKALLRAQCRLTGRDAGFVDHLNFECDPRTFKRWSRDSGQRVHVVDLMAAKVHAVFDPDSDQAPVVARRAQLVRAVKRSPAVARLVAWVLARLPVTPSVMLLFVKAA